MSDYILARVSETLSKEQSLEGLVRQLLEMLETVTDMESTYLTKISDDFRLQHILYSRNTKQLAIPEGFSVPWGDSLCKRALDDNCMFSNEVAKRWQDCEAAQALGITTYLSTPVHLTDGSLYGTLCAASNAKKNLSVRGQQVLGLFAGLIAQFIEKEFLLNQLREANVALVAHSYTDALTGLPNRRAIFENLAAMFALARHRKTHVIIAFIDLDNFKGINDQLGHEAGDKFLIEVGKRLLMGREKGDIVGRLGGDEFLIASPGAPLTQPQVSSLLSLQSSIDARITGNYQLGKHAIFYPGASIGVIEINPEHFDADAALHAADEAMYQVKKNKVKKPFIPLN
ncbi:sensor domain-containing diguanylate cyclase [Enterobacter sp. Bisph1]|uniref:sensor domain-containing diguanylate cyclase n=1 Tax=Enterobacter sp. Bisph1 TaxID=1274399 RepID=UPI00057C0329|nr:sensor domain-containing diguanylate cyclase [Enterobacter sp. Bisph1]